MLSAFISRVARGRVDRRSNRTPARFGIPGLLVACFGILSAVGGCGAFPGGEETTRVDVVFDRTGTLFRDSTFIRLTDTDGIFAGDDAFGRATCAFVSINLNTLPANANLSRVVLNLKATILNNGDPFSKFGAITVDHVNVLNGVNTSDYTGGTLRASIASVPSFPRTARQDVAIDVTSEVNADRAAGRPISSFRFRFDAAPNADGVTDVVVIEASPDDLNQRPSALVTFRR